MGVLYWGVVVDLIECFYVSFDFFFVGVEWLVIVIDVFVWVGYDFDEVQVFVVGFNFFDQFMSVFQVVDYGYVDVEVVDFDVGFFVIVQFMQFLEFDVFEFVVG